MAEMLRRLTNRGPDDEGVALERHVTLGHRRLSILDLSSAGRQPMAHESGRYLVVFNGEIYNHHELRDELGLDPARLRSRTDTEILLHAWARWGPDALPRFVGQWAFAMFDREEGTLWLARDRFGEKPLYYHANAERLMFASSLEALLADRATPRELDPAAVIEYVTLRYVTAPRTVLRGLNKLPGGHLLRIDRDGTIEARTWYEPRFRPARSHSTRAANERAEAFDELFTRACERCLVSDVPVGLLLSDGIDSHSIQAALKARGHDIRSYTFRLTGVGAERGLARTGSGHAIDIELGCAEYLSELDALCVRMTEPVGDLAALATAAIIRRARESTTVFVCGHGADEILGGYRLSQDRFRLAALRRFGSLPLPIIQRGLERQLRGCEPFAERKRWFLSGPTALAPARAKYLIQRPTASAELNQLFGAAWPASERYLGTVDRLYGECAADATDLGRIQEVMIRTFLSGDILPYADSAAMQSSAELRMPFLDRDLVELVCAMPDRERVGTLPGSANTKLSLRRWARGRLPDAIVRRKKRPFPAGEIADLFRDPRVVEDRILGVAPFRRVFRGLEPWLRAKQSDWPARADGVLLSLMVLGVWSAALGVE